MRKKKGNPLQKTMAVILSAVLLIGLISGAAPVQAKAEEISSAATGTSIQSEEDENIQPTREEITPVVYTPAELEADATGATPLPRELEDEILAGTTVEGIDALGMPDYSLTASYDPDTQICTVSFILTDRGREKYYLSERARTTGKCKVKFKIAKKEITALISVPETLEFDATKRIPSEQNIKTEILKKVSVSGVEQLKPSDYILGAVYDAKKGICTVSFTFSSEGRENYVLSENARTVANCKIIIRRKLTDAVDTKIEKGETAPDLKIVTAFPALTDATLSEAEKEAAQTGTDISLIFSIRNVENTLSSTDKETLIQALNEYQIGQYLDISLFKVIGNKRSPITKTAGKIRLTLTLPGELTGKDKKTTREFAVARVHDGEISVLKDMDTDPASVTVDTDCFSVYAIVYKDTAGTGNTGNGDKDKSPKKTKINKKNTGKSDSETGSDDSDDYSNGGDDAPETGDNTPLEFYATVAMISGFSYVLLLFKSGSCGMSEEKKKELVSRIIQWACRGGEFRRITAYAAIVLLLIYYHSIGKKIAFNWEELRSK